jgi:ribonuclease P protein component
MLSKIQKLKLDKEFNEVFKTGRSIYGRFLGVKLIKNKLEHSRFGVILGTKVEKSSVKRHFLRRRIYRAIKETQGLVAFPSDCVIIALPKIKEASFLDLNKDLLEAFNKVFVKK